MCWKDGLKITRNGTDYLLQSSFNIYSVGTPALYTIDNVQGNKGTTVHVSITGASLSSISGLQFTPQGPNSGPDNGITVANVVVNANSLTADVTLTGTALVGPHNISFTNGNGGTFSTSAVFNVLTGGGASVSNSNPTVIHRGDPSTPFNVTGSQLGGVTGLEFFNFDGTKENGISVVSNFTTSGGSVSANLSVGGTISVGPRTVVLDFGANQVFTTLSLIVESQSPDNVYAQSVSPSSTAAGTSNTTVSVSGGSPLNFSSFKFYLNGSEDTSIHLSNFQTNNGQLSASMSIDNTAATGFRNLVLFPTSGGTLNTTLRFNVTIGNPVASDFSPIGASRGQTSVAFVLNGINLTGVTGLQFLSNNSNDVNIGVSNLQVNSGGTQLTANLNIGSSTALQQHSIQVVRGNQQPFGTGFNINIYDTNAPALYTFAPGQGDQGATVNNFTVNGANLTGMSLSFGGGTPGHGITVQSPSASASQITANLLIDSTAPIGPYNLNLNNGEGGNTNTNAQFLVRTSGGTTVMNLNPAFPHRGETDSLSITGTGLGSVTGIEFTNPDGTTESAITPSNLQFSSNSITGTIQLPGDMTIGERHLVLDFAGNVKVPTSLILSVQSSNAEGNVSVSSINPSGTTAGNSLSVSINGNNLSVMNNFKFQASGTDDTTLHVTGVSANQNSLSGNVAIDSDASAGVRKLVLVPASGSPLPTNLVFNVQQGIQFGAMIPAQRVVNTGGFTMDITGSGFASGSRVVFNGHNYSASFIDAQHLSVDISGTEITNVGSLNVKVQVPNPSSPGQFNDSNLLVFNVTSPAMTMSPNPMTIGVGETATLSVSVNQAVQVAGGLDITLSSISPSYASVTTPLHINQDQTTGTATVTGNGVGSSVITATLSGYPDASMTVNVNATSQPSVSVTPASLIMSASGSAIITVSRANEPLVSGLDVNLSVNRPGFFNLPAVLTIPAGQDHVQVTLNGIKADPTPPVIISASAGGHLSGSSTQVTVRLLHIQMTPAILVNPGQTSNLQVVLSDPAPDGGVTINFSSQNTNIATVAASVTIPAGATQASATVTAVTAGNTTITATSAGFPTSTTAVQVQNVGLSILPSSATFLSGSPFAKSVTLVMSVNAIGGGQLVNLSSDTPSVATVPANVLIPSGSAAVNFTVTGTGVGSATITASSPGLNSGTFNASLLAPTFRIDNAQGRIDTYTGIRRLHYVRLPQAAPVGGIPVTITSSDPSKLKVAPCRIGDSSDGNCNDTSAPQNSITLTALAGLDYVYFDVVGQDTAVNTPRLNEPYGVARDAAGNTYIPEYGGGVVRKIDSSTGLVSTFAGTGTGGYSGDNGKASDATFNGPIAATVYNNELYLADYSNNAVRKINLSTNIITTVVAGGGLSAVYDFAIAPNGDLIIASAGNHRIYKFNGSTLTLIAGGGAGSPLSTNVAALSLALGTITSVAVDADGYIYYADNSNHIVNQIDLTGVVHRVAGTGTAGVNDEVSDALNATLTNPMGVTVDRVNHLLYITHADHVARVTLAASQPASSTQPISRIAGSTGGCCSDGLNARFALLSNPAHMSLDSNGNLLIADRSNERIRTIALSTGIIDTVIGDGGQETTGDGLPARGVHVIVTSQGFVTYKNPVRILQNSWVVDVASAAQTIGVPFGFTVHSASNERMADQTSVVMTGAAAFTVTSPVVIGVNQTSVSGTANPTQAGSGSVRAEANGTRFPVGLSQLITVLPVAGSPMRIDNSFARITTATGIRHLHYVRIPFAAGAGGVTVNLSVQPVGSAKISKCFLTDPTNGNCQGGPLSDTLTMTIPQGLDYAYFDLVGQGSVVADAEINTPYGVYVDSQNNVFVADYPNNALRKLSAAGVLSTFAGTGASGNTTISGGNQQATATIMSPISVTGDGSNLFITAYNASAILKVDANGVVSTVAGTLNAAGVTEGAVGTGRLNAPHQVAVGPDGSLYIADYNNHRVRKVPGPGLPNAGNLETLVGGGASTGTDAQKATFSTIIGVAVDPATNDVYFTEYGVHKIWKVSQTAGSVGTLTLIAGTGGTGFNGDQADATQATLYNPFYLHVRGNYLYVADQSNDRVRRVRLDVTPRPIETVAGTTSGGFSGDGDNAVVAQLSNPLSMWTDPAGDLIIDDYSNSRIRKVTLDGKINTIIGSGTQGYAGDGGPGRGVTVHAEVAAGGPSYLPVDVSVNVNQSQWSISLSGTSQTTQSAFTYTVQQSSGERMAADTQFTPTTDTGPFMLLPLTILNNTTSKTGTATPTGASGSGRIIIPAVDTTFNGTTSDVIVVLPAPASPMRIDNSFARITTATGIRHLHYVRIPFAAGAGGVTVNLSVQPVGSAKISKCFLTDPTNGNCQGGPLSDTLTMTIPQGSDYAYFDLVGQGSVVADAEINTPYGVYVDSQNNVFVADYPNNALRKLSAAGVLSTFAGTGASGNTTISGSNQQATATIMSPISVTGDGSNLFITAYNASAILKVDANGVVSTVAGTLNAAGVTEGAVGTGRLNAPHQVAVGPDGSLYIADYNNHRVRKVPGPGLPNAGNLETLAGGGASTGTDAQKATFSTIIGVAVDPATNDVYFTEYGVHKIWKVSQTAGSVGTLTLIAGTGGTGFNGDQADATQATLYNPFYLHVRGNYLYVADQSNDRVRRIRLDVTPHPIETVAGTTSGGFSGDGDNAVVAQLSNPLSMWTDPAGDLIVDDYSNSRIRKVTLDGKINTIIGSGTQGYAGDGGPGRGVTVHAEVASGGPSYLPVDVSVNVNQSQWSISLSGTSQTTQSSFTYTVQQSSGERMAADTTFTPTTDTGPFTLLPLTILNNTTSQTGTATPTGASGSGRIIIPAVGTTFNGTSSPVIVVLPPATPAMKISDSFAPRVTATGARNLAFVRLPTGLVAAGPNGVPINITSSDASRLKVSACNPADSTTGTCTGDSPAAGITVTVQPGQNYAYFDLIGLQTASIDARVSNPYGVYVDGQNNVFVADYNNNALRKLSAAGVLSTFAGTGAGGSTTISGSNQQATATIMSPISVAGDGTNLFITAYNASAILKVDSNGVVSTVAGTLNVAGVTEGAVGTGRLNAPHQVAVGPDGSLYIADYNNHRVRKVPGPGLPNAGNLETLAGGGASTGTDAQKATFSTIIGVAVDPATNDVYFTEYGVHKIWKVSQTAGSVGTLTPIAGTGGTGFNGDQADATQATLYNPFYLHVRGNYLYVADQSNDRVRRIRLDATPTRPIETVAGTTSGGFSGDGDAAVVAQLSDPLSMWTDPAGDLIVDDYSNSRIRKVTLDGKINTIIGSGTAGYEGDGGPGRGVTVHAEVASGGPNYLPADVSVRINQSSWAVDGFNASQSGPTFNFTVHQTASELSNARMIASTTIGLLSTNSTVLTVPSEFTLGNNVTSVQGTATAVAAGNAQITVSQPGANGIGQGSSTTITITSVITSVTNGSGPANQTTDIILNGRNFVPTGSSITGPSGITGTVNGGSSTALNVSIHVPSGVAAGAQTLTLQTPGGNVTFTFTVNATDSTWVGGAAGAATDWLQAANWSPSGVPTATSKVVIPQTANQPMLTGNASTADLTVLTGATINTGTFNLTVAGNLANTGSITGNGVLVMNGTAKTVAGSISSLTVSGTVTAAAILTVNGNLSISNTLDVNGQTMLVTGNLDTTGNGGVLKMVNAAGVVTVNGNATFTGGDASAAMTAGLLKVKGNFTQNHGVATTFAASGTHKVLLNGSAAQTVSFADAGLSGSRFMDLEIANTGGGVTFLTASQVNHNLDITTGATVGGSVTVTVESNVTSVASSNITLSGLTIGGNLAASGTYAAGTTIFKGTTSITQAVWTTNLSITGTATLAANTVLTGSVSVPGTLDINGQTMTISGDFITTPNSGVLKMQNSSGILNVSGNATFSGANNNGFLTAGVLNVKGNFTQNHGVSSTFATSGTHKTVLNGNAAQTVSFADVGSSTSTSHFMDLEIANTSGGVSFLTAAQINHNLSLTTTATVSGSVTVTADGDVTTVAGSNVTTTGVTIGGNLSSAGTWAPNTTTFKGTTAISQSTWTTNVSITGTASMSANSTLTGNLTISGSLDLNGKTLGISGNLSTTSNSGVLKMQNAAGVVNVGGNATFAGADENGLLSAGCIYLSGNFAQNHGVSSTFSASGTHRVVMNGSGAQTISFADIGSATSSSHFQILELANVGSGVTLSTNAIANGQLVAQATELSKQMFGAGKTLTVGGLDVTGVALDNVLLVVTPGTLTKFDNVSFANYAATATQLSISHPGAASAFTFNNLVFSATPPTTGFYINATDTVADANTFTINLVSPTPAHATQFHTSGGAVITWP